MRLDVPRLESLDVRGKRALVRVDFNVPQDDSGAISDDTRIRASVPTIRWLLEHGAKPVLLSHLGRPKGKVVEDMRLTPMGKRLAELLGTPVRKLDASTGEDVARAIREAAANEMKGILEYTEDPIVSSDVLGNPASSVYDAKCTMLIGDRMVKVVAWYDNEWGYSTRVVELMKFAHELSPKATVAAR